MPKHKKKFINKKNAVTFHLVHRSQKDPLIVDETAPQNVLVEEKSTKNKDEEHKYGIFFDDDYDYMQHLKSSDAIAVWEPIEPNSRIKIKSCNMTKAKMNLPSSVFASEVEEPVGLLNKAAPVSGLCLDLDPDIVAAMDDDFDYDDPNNVLEDNFIELANQGDDDKSEYSEDSEGEEERDEVGSLDNDEIFEREETKSRFTNYSLTSSVIRRNEHLTLLDDRFEKMFEDYEESAIGALDCEEIEGGISAQDEILKRLAGVSFGNKEDDIDIKEKTIQALERLNESNEELEELVVEPREKWDCESILSTYSNIYNHPAKISVPKGPVKIKINKKTGIPMNVLNSNKLTAEALAHLNQTDKPCGPKSVISQLSELSIRPKDESPSEKKLRKQNLKIYRRERRIEKKANTEAFKEEKIRQEKVLLNFKNNQQGIKIL